MEKSRIVFDDFFVKNTDKKLIIKAKLIYSGLENFGYFGVYLIPVIFFWYIIPSSPVIMGYIKIIILIAIFFIGRSYIKSALSKTILVVNKVKNVLYLDMFEDALKFSDIKKIEILEVENFDTEDFIYKLKFNLPEGSKTSAFAFSRYNQAKQIVDILKKELGLNEAH